MRQLLLSISFITLFGTGCVTTPSRCGPTPEQEAASAAAAAQGAKTPPEERVVCSKQMVTGSNIPKCVCQKEYEREEDRAAADKFKRNEETLTRIRANGL
jgi:hypothetical protein